MERTTGLDVEGAPDIEATATSSAVPPGAEGSNVGRWVAIEQGGKLILKKSFFDMPKELRDNEPHRPLRPSVQKAFGPSLYSDLTRCYDWIEWAESYMQELGKNIVDKDIELASERKKAADTIADLHKKYQQKSDSVHTATLAAVRKYSDKKMQDAAEELDELEKRGKELEAAETRTKQIQAKSKTYQDLSRAVLDMGDKVEKAVRGMRNLTAHKNTPQSAFDKWEKVHCESNIRLVELNRQVQMERDENRRKYTERVKAVREREEQAAELILRKKEDMAMLVEERQQFTEEQQEWRLRQGRDLSDSELKGVMENWLEQKIEELKPAMLTEARRCNWELQKVEWGAQNTTIIAEAEEQGRKEGRSKGDGEGYVRGKEDGIKQGFEKGWMEAYADLQEDTIEATAKAHDQSYAEGYAAGEIEGHTKGHDDGMIEGIDEGYERGKEAGHSEGRTEGYEEGKAESYEKGRAAGQSQGHQKGRAKGKSEGREQGYQEGWEVGHEEGFIEGQEEGLKEAEDDAEHAYNAGYDDAKRSWRRRCAGEYEAGKDDGYNLGWDAAKRGYHRRR